MLDQPLFTIAIPVIKDQYFKEALLSAINQIFDNFEIIIVNNSNDDLVKNKIRNIVNEYRNVNLKYFENPEHKDVISDWNYCLSLAKGKYFCLLSDDDKYEPEYLSEMAAIINKHPGVDLFHVRVRIINEKNELISISTSCPEYESCLNFIYHRIRNLREQFISDFMVKTSKLQNIGGYINFPSACCSDDATWFIISNSKGVVFINKLLFNYRKSLITLSKKDTVENKLNAYNQYEIWVSNFLINELFVEKHETEIYDDLQKHLNKMFVLNKGNALSISNDRNFGLFRVIINWFSYKIKYRINCSSLLWAILLFINTKFKKNFY